MHRDSGRSALKLSAFKKGWLYRDRQLDGPCFFACYRFSGPSSIFGTSIALAISRLSVSVLQ